MKTEVQNGTENISMNVSTVSGFIRFFHSDVNLHVVIFNLMCFKELCSNCCAYSVFKGENHSF